MHRIHIRKEACKFSSAHMTVFPDGQKEALHGHNYVTAVEIDFQESPTESFTPFSVLKQALAKICDAWDEKVLLARRSPFFEIRKQTPQELDFTLCQKRYVLPADEVVLLEVENITSEALAEEFCRRFVQELKIPQMTHPPIQIQVRIEESPGQGASSFWHPSK